MKKDRTLNKSAVFFCEILLPNQAELPKLRLNFPAGKVSFFFLFFHFKGCLRATKGLHNVK
ncbi:unknown [[Mannheimia] succiniciproducens MBEL55E]|uniref:Uncharacterized protein n=1 Tax=Mannheimia succiniciproducens (strain KCTC 0769BP / MBEL55E) TaxID=221988 RepID=Q65W63_MANSM|nr:unknown [[Mannheimia] succiniciproducens MBEL55E]